MRMRKEGVGVYAEVWALGATEGEYPIPRLAYPLNR